MAKSEVKLSVIDNGFNAKIKNAMQLFARLGNAASGAKGQFSKFADGIAKVAQSQELLNTALKGNPYGMMAQAATMAFTKIIDLATQASDAEIRMAQEAEMKAERQQSANEAIGRSTGELMAKYELLRVQWNNLSTDQQRIDWINANQSAFKSLNLAVTGVTSAEDVFVNNTSKVVAALKARAEAEAYAELYKEQIKKNAMNKATGKYNVPPVNQDYRPTRGEAQVAGLTAEDYEYRQRKVHNRYGEEGYIKERTGRLTQSGVDKINRVRQMGQASLENADEMQASYWANKMAEAQANAAALSNNSLFGGAGGGKGGKGGKMEVPVKPVYVPEEGTADYVKAMIADMQKQVGMEKDSDKRIGLLMDIQALQEEYKNMTTLPNIGEDMADDFEIALGPLQKLNQELGQLKKDLETVPSSDAYQEQLQKIADKEKEIAQFKGESLEKSGKAIDRSWSQASQAVASVGTALSMIEDPGAKIAATIAQAIASIIAGFGDALGRDQSTKSNIWAFFAAATQATIQMAAMVAQVHSLSGYAQGGVVDGKSYSGDNIPILANAGEIVLSKSMQNSLAANLQSNAGSVNLEATVSGEQIRFVLNNYGRRTGRGEYVTTKFQ